MPTRKKQGNRSPRKGAKSTTSPASGSQSPVESTNRAATPSLHLNPSPQQSPAAGAVSQDASTTAPKAPKVKTSQNPANLSIDPTITPVPEMIVTPSTGSLVPDLYTNTPARPAETTIPSPGLLEPGQFIGDRVLHAPLTFNKEDMKVAPLFSKPAGPEQNVGDSTDSVDTIISKDGFKKPVTPPNFFANMAEEERRVRAKSELINSIASIQVPGQRNVAAPTPTTPDKNILDLLPKGPEREFAPQEPLIVAMATVGGNAGNSGNKSGSRDRRRSSGMDTDEIHETFVRVGFLPENPPEIPLVNPFLPPIPKKDREPPVDPSQRAMVMSLDPNAPIPIREDTATRIRREELSLGIVRDHSKGVSDDGEGPRTFGGELIDGEIVLKRAKFKPAEVVAFEKHAAANPESECVKLALAAQEVLAQGALDAYTTSLMKDHALDMQKTLNEQLQLVLRETQEQLLLETSSKTKTDAQKDAEIEKMKEDVQRSNDSATDLRVTLAATQKELAEMERFKKEARAATAELAAVKSDLLDCQGLNAKLTSKAADDNIEKDLEIYSLKEEIVRLKDALDDHRPDNDEIEKLKKELAEYRTKANDLEEQLKKNYMPGSQADNEKLRKENHELKEMNKKMRFKLKDIDKERGGLISVQECENRHKDLLDELDQLKLASGESPTKSSQIDQAKLAQLTYEKVLLEKRLKDCQDEKNKLPEEVLKLQKEISILKRENDNMTSKLLEHEQALLAFQRGSNHSVLHSEHEALKKENARHEKELADCNAKRDAESSSSNSLKDHVRDLGTAAAIHSKELQNSSAKLRQLQYLTEEETVPLVSEKWNICQESKRELLAENEQLRKQLGNIKTRLFQTQANLLERPTLPQMPVKCNPTYESLNMSLIRVKIGLEIMRGRRAEYGPQFGDLDTAVLAADEAIQEAEALDKPRCYAKAYFWKSIVSYYDGDPSAQEYIEYAMDYINGLDRQKDREYNLIQEWFNAGLVKPCAQTTEAYKGAPPQTSISSDGQKQNRRKRVCCLCKCKGCKGCRCKKSKKGIKSKFDKKKPSGTTNGAKAPTIEDSVVERDHKWIIFEQPRISKGKKSK